MTKQIILFVLMGTLSIGFWAGDRMAWQAPEADNQMMLVANQLYENGDYQAAAQAYQQLVDIGTEDATLYYNLGNAYFKEGDFGRAVLYYRRAAELDPRDDEIQTNLELARRQVIDRYERGNNAPVNQLAAITQPWLTINETAVITLILWFLLAILFLVQWHLRPSPWREGVQYALFLVVLLWLFGLVSLGSRITIRNNQPAGVIVVEEVAVMSGPGDQYVTEFLLHSGTEVTLIEARRDWVRLRLPLERLEGWVMAVDVTAVARDWGGE